MRLLLIHSDYIEYEAKKKTKMAEEGAVLTDAKTKHLRSLLRLNPLTKKTLKASSSRPSKR